MVEWKVTIPRWPRRRIIEWHSADGRWVVRYRKLDKWRKAWVVYDRQERKTVPLSWGAPDSARRYVEDRVRRQTGR